MSKANANASANRNANASVDAGVVDPVAGSAVREFGPRRSQGLAGPVATTSRTNVVMVICTP